MKYLGTGIIALVCALGAFSLMWWAWRARSRRDAPLTPTSALAGTDLKRRFERVFYVATTRVGEPLERVAIAGLKYRGYARVDVFADGVRVQVDGEAPVDIAKEDISDAGNAQMRIDKVVERDGLALLNWESSGVTLESSFRFSEGNDHAAFIAQIHDLVGAGTDNSSAAQETA